MSVLPIGVIDSGIGGLTVMHEIIKRLPRENIIYVGDTARCPYGSKSKEEIIEYTMEMVTFLRTKKIKALVIACNTATAYTFEILKRELEIPIIGVIKPGANAAFKKTNNKRIGIIATEATINSKEYNNALINLDASIYTKGIACPGFVPLIEKGYTNGNKLDQEIKKYLTDVKKHSNIDTLILGCTHYPLIERPIQDYLGKKIQIVSSGVETAIQLETELKERMILNDIKTKPVYKVFTTDNSIHFSSILVDLIPKEIIFENGLELKSEINIGG